VTALDVRVNEAQFRLFADRLTNFGQVGLTRLSPSPWRDVVPLPHGKTDKNAYRAASGMEYYRPLEGTPTGAEDEVRKRPDVDLLSVVIPRDQVMASKVVEAIYEVHCYYEPVIYIQEILRSRCKGLDDSDNPHRWWNKSGDWKADGAANE